MALLKITGFKLAAISLLFCLLSLAAQAQKPFTGKASFYADSFHGQETANGEIYNKDSFTAAHRTLPFGTVVRVTNPKNNKSVTVRINDRGPMRKNRTIDLSRAAARELGFIKSGIIRVKMEILYKPPVEQK